VFSVVAASQFCDVPICDIPHLRRSYGKIFEENMIMALVMLTKERKTLNMKKDRK
jgi:hypothetical protein